MESHIDDTMNGCIRDATEDDEDLAERLNAALDELESTRFSDAPLLANEHPRDTTPNDTSQGLRQSVTKKAPKTEEEKAAARAQRKAEKAARELAEQEEQRRLLTRRQDQLGIAKAAVDALDRKLDAARERQQARSDLESHATGFYEEIDKLARGKSLFEATTLVVEKANEIVKDAKDLMKGDVYLDRVREFVPAGNNPVYPDVVITIKNVLQALERAESRFASMRKAAREAYGDALTIHEALRLYCEQPDTVSKDDVGSWVEEDLLNQQWFDEDTEEFSFERLDETDLSQYFADDMNA